MDEISRIMGIREGAAEGEEKDTPARIVSYLQAILFSKYTQDRIGPRMARELRTLAEAMDHLEKGRLPQLEDARRRAGRQV